MALVAALDPTLSVDDQGVVRVGGTRVTLRSVVSAYQQGATAEEISIQYPSLGLVDVYAAITYYLRNQKAVDDLLGKEDHKADELFRLIEDRRPTAELRQRLRSRLVAR
jgi:uncharacterized protein (DUF433 family)